MQSRAHGMINKNEKQTNLERLDVYGNEIIKTNNKRKTETAIVWPRVCKKTTEGLYVEVG